MSNIGETIRTARDAKNMSRDDLAKKLDISKGYLSLMETNGRVHISARVMDALKKALGNKINKIKKEQIEKNNRLAYMYRHK